MQRKKRPPQLLDISSEAERHWQGMPEFNQEDKWYKTIVVHFYDDEGVQDFLEKTGMRVRWGRNVGDGWFPEYRIDRVPKDWRWKSES